MGSYGIFIAIIKNTIIMIIYQNERKLIMKEYPYLNRLQITPIPETETNTKKAVWIRQHLKISVTPKGHLTIKREIQHLDSDYKPIFPPEL
jgi:hypothetical protein